VEVDGLNAGMAIYMLLEIVEEPWKRVSVQIAQRLLVDRIIN